MNPAAVLQIYVNAQTGPAVRGLMRVNTSLEATEKRSNKAVAALKSIGKTAAVGGIVGVGAAAVYSAKKAADFEQQMDSLGSVSGATGRQMKRFEKQALAAGAATKFSALDAARAQTELAKGGLGVAQIMRGGLKSALALAAAGEMELADAAETTANAMKLFGLRGKDSMKVADALATAANRTTADVHDFAMALKMGGSVAKIAGLSFNDTVVVLEALAEAGIKNSDAGTSMKAFFLNITRDAPKAKEAMKALGVNIFTASGELKSLPAISSNLRKAFGDLTKEQFLQKAGTIAGSDAIRTLYALYDAGPEKLKRLDAATAKAGTAADVARKKQDNLKGQLENLQGSIETLAIKLGLEMLPALTSATRAVTRFISQMSSGKGKGGEFAAALKDIWPVVRTIVIWFGKAASMVISWQRITSKAIHAVADFFTDVWNAPKRAFGNLIASMLRGFAKLFDVAEKIPGIGGKFKGLGDELRRDAAMADRLGEEIRDVKSKRVKVNVDILAAFKGSGARDRAIHTLPGGDGWGIPGKIDAHAGAMGAQWGKENVGQAIGAVGRGSAALQGAGSHLGPFAALGAHMGLSVSSGYFGREHSITSSGNLSLHSQRRAIDMADGPAAMLAYAKVMANSYGPRLAELIHTPMGFSIKNGQRVPPYAQRDHYDHVHVAMAKGGTARKKVRALVGEKGPEIVDLPVGARVHSHSRSKRMVAQMGGFLPGFASGGKVVYDYMLGKGFTPAQAAGWVGVFGKESGFSTTVRNPNSGATGLAQWLGSRLTALKSKRNWQSMQTQLKFVWEELMGPESAAYRAIKGARSPGEAAQLIDSRYERSDAILDAVARANAAFKNYGGKAKPRGGGKRGTVKGGARGSKEAFVGSGLTLGDQITKAQGVLEAAEATDVLDDDSAARKVLIGLHGTRETQIRTRLRKINKALGGRKASVAARRRLTAERSTLLGELNTTRGEIRSLEAESPAAEASRLAAEAANRLADEIAALRAESKQLADRQEYLVNRQGPQLVAALTMALSGNMGRAAALGRRTPAAAGRTASL